MQTSAFVPTRRPSLFLRLLLGIALSTAASLTSAQAQIVVGTNVNMVGAPGYVDPVTGEIINDPTLNRQNEPSHAFSTRNPCHILAGSNDYRLVDFETPLIGDELADAWLSVYKSFDCGRTWTSTPHPGHQLDLTAAGRASPIYGRQAGADATVRALPGGKFMMSGLAFNRGGIAQVFVSLFEDRNNKDGGDSIDWLGTTVVATGTAGQFLDKPWLATTASGEAYVAYTVFTSLWGFDYTKIMVSKFDGAGWSTPRKVSHGLKKNQGATIAVDPGTKDVYVAWREYTIPGDNHVRTLADLDFGDLDLEYGRDAIVIVRSTNGGQSFSWGRRVEPDSASRQPYRLKPFDQDASFVTFRTFSYPTMAIIPAVAEGRPANQPGRVYLAWAARGFVPLRNNHMPGQTSNQILGDTRVVYSTSTNGLTWTYPKAADDSADAGHQLMPTLASAGGKLALAYYDLRADASLTFDDNVIEYGQAAFDACMAQSVGVEGFNVVQCMIGIPSVVLQRRHTIDVRAAVADGACLVSGTCTLSSVSALNGNRQVSRYLRAYTGAPQGLVQLQYNSPNLPLFKKGSRAFIGDYIDIQGLDYLPNGSGGWRWNTGATAGSPAPMFMVTWTDNRNVRRPGSAGWEQFTRINSAACEPGQAGIRNQDVYSAVIRSGLSVSAPLNARLIGDLQRSFPIVIANNTDQPRSYHASVNAPANVVGSFDQFAGFGVGLPVTSLDLSIPPRSTATRTLFVLKTDGAEANVLVPVLVAEVGGTGQTDTVFLNPDLLNPDAADASVGAEELHVPVLGDPTLKFFTNTPDIKTPDFETPDFETPDFETPDFETPDFETPDFETPDFETPDFETPDFETPDFETPDFETAAVADVSWKVTNVGNVTSAYKPNINIQDSKVGTRYQLVVRTISVQSLTSALSCKPGLLPQNQMLVNIVDPHVQSQLVGLTSADFNDPDPKNATFTLGSNQSAVITLRAYCNANAPGANGPGGCAAEGPLPLDLTGRPLVSTSSVAQAANCQRCTSGDCNLDDFVGSGTACTVDDGLPKDIYDPIPPMFGSAPTPVADDINNSGDEDMTFTVSVTDNIAVTSLSCSNGVVTPGSTGSYSVSGTFPVGSTAVTCDAVDGSGNHSELSFDVVVNDITPPAFDIAGSDPGAPFGPSNPAEASGAGGAVVTYTNPSASDSNGGPVTVTCASSGGLVSGSTFPIGTTDINCVATDDSGASTPPTNLFDITVADHTPPAITVTDAPAAAVEGGALGGALVTFNSSAVDTVSGPVVPTCSPASGSLFPVGRTTVTCHATDAAGNGGSSTFEVVVADVTPPVLGSVANLIAEATSSGGAAVSYTKPTATDVVDADVAVSCVSPSGSLFPIGPSTVTCTATDDSGNFSTSAFTITVGDTTAPVVGGMTNITAEASSGAGAVVAFATPSATDAVGATVSCAPASGSTFALGTAIVTCTATDTAGNHSSVNFNVNVVDTTPPILTVPANISVPATSPSGATVTYAAATATDIADAVVPVVCSKGSGTTFPITTTTVSCTATDDSSNATTRTFTVTVTNTAPTFTPPANITRSATSAAGAVVSFTVTGSDVEDLTIGAVCAPASGSTFAITTTTVNCTVTDSGGLIATGSFTVTVTNNAPVAGNGALTTNEDTAAAGTLSGTDIDGPSRAFSIVANGSKGIVTITNAATGAFTYTPNANASGADSFTFKLNDGIVNSNTATVAVTINASNDAPTFVKGANQTTIANSSATTVTNWATAISRGPSDESGQTASFIVTNSNNALFTTQPAIGSTGTLTFKSASSAKGVATVTVTLKDNGGTANGGQDTSAAQTFTITVNMTYGVINKQNFPPSTYLTRGTTVAMKWQFATGGDGDYDADDIVNSSNASPLLTIVGPAGSGAKTYTFTQEAPGTGNSFGLPTSANGYTWQFNWLTKDAGVNLPAGYYTISLTSRLTGQVFARGQIQLK